MTDNSFENLGIQSSHATLMGRLKQVVKETVGMFRQAVASDGVQAGPIKLTNHDLDRTHKIIAEIDDKRAFIKSNLNENPEFVIESIEDTRKEIRKLVGGIWADELQEKLIQRLQEEIANFLTDMERISPIPNDGSNPKWKQFSERLEELRLKVWTIIAAMINIHGDILRPRHLPEEIAQEVRGQIRDQQE